MRTWGIVLLVLILSFYITSNASGAGLPENLKDAITAEQPNKAEAGSPPGEPAAFEWPYIWLVSDVFKAILGPHDGKPANKYAPTKTPPAKGAGLGNSAPPPEPPYQSYVNWGFLLMVLSPAAFFFASKKIAVIMVVGGLSAFLFGRWFPQIICWIDIAAVIALIVLLLVGLYAAWLHKDDIWKLIMHNDVLSKHHPKKNGKA